MRFGQGRGVSLAIALLGGLAASGGVARAWDWHTIPRETLAQDFRTGGVMMAPPIPYGEYVKDYAGCIHGALGMACGCIGKLCGFCHGRGCGHCGGLGCRHGERCGACGGRGCGLCGGLGIHGIDPCGSCGGRGCGLCGGIGHRHGLGHGHGRGCNQCGGAGCGLCGGPAGGVILTSTGGHGHGAGHGSGPGYASGQIMPGPAGHGGTLPSAQSLPSPQSGPGCGPKHGGSKWVHRTCGNDGKNLLGLCRPKSAAVVCLSGPNGGPACAPCGPGPVCNSGNGPCGPSTHGGSGLLRCGFFHHGGDPGMPCGSCGGRGCGLCRDPGHGKGCWNCGGRGCALCRKHLLGLPLPGIPSLSHVKYFVGPGGPVPITPGYVPYVVTTRSPRDYFAFPPFVDIDP